MYLYFECICTSNVCVPQMYWHVCIGEITWKGKQFWSHKCPGRGWSLQCICTSNVFVLQMYVYFKCIWTPNVFVLQMYVYFQTENLLQVYMSKPPPPKCASPPLHLPRLSGGCNGGQPSTGCAGCLPHTIASSVAPFALCHLLIWSSCGLCFCMASEGGLVQSLTWEYSHKQFTSLQKRWPSVIFQASQTYNI